jgi:hypothetical protein
LDNFIYREFGARKPSLFFPSSSTGATNLRSKDDDLNYFVTIITKPKQNFTAVPDVSSLGPLLFKVYMCFLMAHSVSPKIKVFIFSIGV